MTTLDLIMGAWDISLLWMDMGINVGGERQGLSSSQPFVKVAGNVSASSLFDVLKAKDVNRLTNFVESIEERGSLEQAEIGGQAEVKPEWSSFGFDPSLLCFFQLILHQLILISQYVQHHLHRKGLMLVLHSWEDHSLRGS